MKGPTEIVMGGSKYGLPHDNDVNDYNEGIETFVLNVLEHCSVITCQHEFWIMLMTSNTQIVFKSVCNTIIQIGVGAC